MLKSIELHQKQIAYTLRHSSRARCMRLTIYGDGNFVVTVPRGVSENSVEHFISAKSRWIIEKLERFKKFSGLVLPKSSKREFLERKDEAMLRVKSRIAHFNALYRFTFNSIHIRNQKTRWGSCSRRGNLNFNYKIVHLPGHLQDLIIVHELCHLQEFNHSRKFWDLVSKAVPNYREARRELRNTGMRYA